MPTYEYKGHEFSSEKELTSAEWAQTLAYFDSIGPKKQEPTKTTGVEEGFGHGFIETALGMGQRIAKGLGRSNEDLINKARTAKEEAIYNSDTVDLPIFGETRTAAFGAGLGDLTAKMIPSIAAAPLLAPIIPASVTGAGSASIVGPSSFLGRAGVDLAIQGVPTGEADYQKRYTEVLEKTGDPELAQQAAKSAGLTSAASMVLPASAGGNLLTRAGVGAASNVGLSQYDIANQNEILQAHPELQQETWSKDQMLIDAITGGAFGAMGSKAPFKTETSPHVRGEYIPSDVKKNLSIMPWKEELQAYLPHLKNSATELQIKLSDLQKAKLRTKNEISLFKIEEEIARTTEELDATIGQIKTLEVGKHHDFENGYDQQTRTNIESDIPSREELQAKVEQRVAAEQVPESAYRELQQEMVPERTETPIEASQMELPITTHSQPLKRDAAQRSIENSTIDQSAREQSVKEQEAVKMEERAKFWESKGKQDTANLIRQDIQRMMSAESRPHVEPQSPKELIDQVDNHVQEVQQYVQQRESVKPPEPIKSNEPNTNVGRILQQFQKGGDWLLTHAFTKQMYEMYREVPAIRALGDAVHNTIQNKTQILRDLLQGISQDKFAFKRLSDPKSIEALAKKMNATEWLDVHNVFEKLNVEHDPMMSKDWTTDQKIDYEKRQLEAAIKDMSPDQQQLAKTLQSDAFRAERAANDMYAQSNIDYKVPHRMFHTFISRPGKYGVVVSWNGVPFKLQKFISEFEAKQFMKDVNSKGHKGLTVEHVTDDAKNNQQSIALQEQILYMQERMKTTGESGSQLMAAMLNELDGTNKSIGGHLLHRSGMTGYAGTEWFQTKQQRAERYLNHLENSITEYVDMIARRSLAFQAAMIRHDLPMSERHDEIFETLLASEMSATQRWGSKTKNGFTKDRVEPIGQLVKESFEKYRTGRTIQADQLAVDAFINVMNKFTYIKTLVFAPSQMIAQYLGFTAASRDLFNQRIKYKGVEIAANNNPLKAAASMGQAIIDSGKLALGQFDSLPKDIQQGLIHMSQQTEAFQPHISNEMLNQSKMTDLGRKQNELWKKLSSGPTFADTSGRITAWLAMYHNLKDKGLTGKPLWDLCGKLTTSNMLMADKRSLPLMIRKSGLVGDLVSPLKGYGLGFAGNLTADMRQLIKNPKELNNHLRLAATALGAAIAGGCISAPLVAEYDLLMMLMGKPEAMISRKLLEISPDWATFGVLSVTGLDVQSGARYHSLGDLWNVNQGILSNLAGVSVAGTALSGVGTLISNSWTDVSKADNKKAVMDIVPRGPLQGVVDELLFDAGDNNMIKKSGTEQAIAENTPTARIGTFLGMKSVDERKNRMIEDQDRIAKDRDIEKTKKALELIVEGNYKGIKILESLELTPREIRTKIKNAIKTSEIPELERKLQGNSMAAKRFRSKYGEMYDNR